MKKFHEFVVSNSESFEEIVDSLGVEVYGSEEFYGNETYTVKGNKEQLTALVEAYYQGSLKKMLLIEIETSFK